MKTTLEMINRMESDGVIGKYAVGGAVGVTFYLEPLATADVDIFVMLPTALGSSLLSRAPIYDYLRARGCQVEGERIVVGGLCSSCQRIVRWSKTPWPMLSRLRLREWGRGY